MLAHIYIYFFFLDYFGAEPSVSESPNSWSHVVALSLDKEACFRARPLSQWTDVHAYWDASNQSHGCMKHHAGTFH